jgi:hypothetical protein
MTPLVVRAACCSRASRIGLIDAWVKADDFNRRTTAARYTAFGGNPIEIAHQLASWSKEQSVPLAFTQWVAGWLRHPYTEPAVTSAYVARLPEAATLERLGLAHLSNANNRRSDKSLVLWCSCSKNTE